MKYGALKAWDLSGGRLARWNAEAVEEYAQARMSGDWYDLSRTQKAKWIARNPLAWMRGQSFSQRYKAVKRTQEYERDVAFVRDYLARTGTGGKKSSMIKESDPDTGDESDTTADDIENAAERTSDALDIAGSASELADEAQGLEDGSARTAGIGYASSALGMGLNAYGLYKAGKDLKESRQQGDSRGMRQAVYGVLSNAVDLGGNFAGFFSTNAAEAAGGVLGAVSGAINMVAGGDTAVSGFRQKRAAEGVKGEVLHGRTREELSDDELLMHDTAAQAAMVGTENMIKGTGEAIGGALDIASGVTSASGAGAVVGAGLTGASFAVKGATAAATALQHSRIKRKVSEQTINLNDEMIDRILAERQMENTPQNRRRIKRAILRAHGYKTGYREELLRDQTAKRSSRLAQMANAAAAKPEHERTMMDRLALRMVGGLGVRQTASGYNEEAIAKNLGNEDGMGAAQKLRDQTNRISAMARGNREARARAASPASSSSTPAAASTTPAPAATPSTAASTTPAPAPAAPARHTPPQRTPPPVPPRPVRTPATPAPAPSSASASGASTPAPPARHTPPQRTPPPVPPRPAAPAPASAAPAPRLPAMHPAPRKPLPPAPPKKKKVPVQP